MLKTVYNYIFLLPLVLLISCGSEKEITLPYYNTPDFTPAWFSSKEEAEQKITHTIQDFHLTNQEGKTIDRSYLNGHIHVANFFFTSCPSFCPRMTNNLIPLQEKYRSDPEVLLISYSVTPWNDSVPRLKQYAETYNIIPDKWQLLTGKTSDIYALARTSYFAEEDLGYTKDSTDFLHTENVILVDKGGRIRGLYKGTLPLDMQRLVNDIEELKKE